MMAMTTQPGLAYVHANADPSTALRFGSTAGRDGWDDNGESGEAGNPSTLGVCDFLSSVVVCGRKAPKSICQQASPGSFDSAP